MTYIVLRLPQAAITKRLIALVLSVHVHSSDEYLANLNNCDILRYEIKCVLKVYKAMIHLYSLSFCLLCYTYQYLLYRVPVFHKSGFCLCIDDKRTSMLLMG